jgi:hypothetical protein
MVVGSFWPEKGPTILVCGQRKMKRGKMKRKKDKHHILDS